MLVTAEHRMVVKPK